MSFLVGAVQIEKTAALAPLAGVADRAFREICKEQGAGYVVGEMTSSKGLTFQNKKTAALLSLGPDEHPAGIQLFGDEPDTMAEAARQSLVYGPDIIDINMGCPAPKIAASGGGAALMKNPALAEKIISAVAKAVPVPVTVKIRKGWDDTSINAVEFAKMAEAAGAAAITIHGRTRQQMYTGAADWEIIARVKQAVTVPVIGNGDLAALDDAVRMYERTGVDLVMIGRGALGNPYLFRQIHEYFTNGTRLPDEPLAQRLTHLWEQAGRAVQYKGEKVALREMRKHAAWYFKGIHSAASLRAAAGKIETLEDLKKLIQTAVEQNEIRQTEG